MNSYALGKWVALRTAGIKVASIDEPTNTENAFGIGGGLAGAYGGTVLGELLAKELAKRTRTLGIPGTGMLDNSQARSYASIAGGALGALGGTRLGRGLPSRLSSLSGSGLLPHNFITSDVAPDVAPRESLNINPMDFTNT